MKTLFILINMLLANNVFSCTKVQNIAKATILDSAKKEIHKSGFHLIGLQIKKDVYYGSKEIVSSLIFCKADKTLIIRQVDKFCTNDIELIKLYVSQYNGIVKKIYTDLGKCDFTNN